MVSEHKGSVVISRHTEVMRDGRIRVYLEYGFLLKSIADASILKR